jgi:uncharacterized protein YcaQ
MLSVQQARNLHLAAQGLLVPARARATRAALLGAIERMRLLQIDTIHIVARSPYLVLFSRIGDYPAQWLDDALARGDLFECWAHEACFAPMTDFALHRHPSALRAGHWAHKQAARMQREHAKDIADLLAQVRKRGAVKASDFGSAPKGGAGGWWGWKIEKRWLEAGFVLGELMVARRDHFHRVYDVAERVLANANPALIEKRPAEAEIRREFILGAARALGIAQARWIGDYFRLGKKYKDTDLETYTRSGELIRVDVRGFDQPGYVHRDNAHLLERARRGALRATHTSLLSPFDPVVWDRERARALFGFDYTLECYTPASKRKFGYYTLPILHRGRLVGRLDAKAHRAQGLFEVKAIYLEADIDATPQWIDEVAQAIRRTAQWHATPRITIVTSVPQSLAKSLRDALG